MFGGNGTHCFAKKTSRDQPQEKPSPFLENSGQSQSSKPRYIIQEELNISKVEHGSLVDSTRNFLQTFDQQTSVHRFHYQNPK